MRRRWKLSATCLCARREAFNTSTEAVLGPGHLGRDRQDRPAILLILFHAAGAGSNELLHHIDAESPAVGGSRLHDHRLRSFYRDTNGPMR